MAFGMEYAPATFERMIDSVLRGGIVAYMYVLPGRYCCFLA